MKKLIILALAFSFLTATAQDKKDKFTIPVGKWNAKVLGLNNFYPTYLADPLGCRVNVNAQRTLFGDIDMEDAVNSDGSYLGKLTITPGARLSLFKFSPKSNPKLGVELDFGVTTPIIMRAGNQDLISVDGIYYFAIAGNPTEWLSLRFSKHHICTHIGEEYYIGNTKSAVDFDPNITQLPVRDDFILSAAAKPLYFLGNEKWNVLQVYGDFGFFWPGGDFLGRRQNKPHREAWINLQGGIEGEYYFDNEYFGGVFAAGNVSAYQLNAYSPNISFVAGYIVPQEREEHKLRLGINYYNGRPLSNQFYNRKEKFLAFVLSVDL